MKQRFRVKKEIEEGDWLLTYSDLVTLVLVFFVLLYSFSQIDIVKFQSFIASFQGTGILDHNVSPLDEEQPKDPNQTELLEQLAEEMSERAVNIANIYEMTTEYLREQGLSDQVDVTYNEGGIALDIKEKILFDSGKAVLKPEARELLDKLRGLFLRLSNQVYVEGDTDNRAINTAQYPTNWELSADRAVKVVRYLTEEKGLDSGKFVAMGYGQYKPVAPNNSPENQAQNRRVVLLIVVAENNAGEVRD